MTTSFSTGEKAANGASVVFTFTAVFCLAFSLAFYLAIEEKFIFKSIAMAIIISALVFSYISGREKMKNAPIQYWASTLRNVLTCLYLTFSLQPLFFITSLPGTAYWVMTSISLVSGLVSASFGKHYFDPKTLKKKMAKEGMLKEGFAEGSRTVSGVIFHAFRTPTNPVTLLFLKIFKSLLIGFAILAVLFGASAGFILLALSEIIWPTTAEMSRHAVGMFLVALPMTTAGMAYVYPITAFIQQWKLSNTMNSEK